MKFVELSILLTRDEWIKFWKVKVGVMIRCAPVTWRGGV